MPYSVRKRPCKQSSGKRGSYTLSYTDKKGKHHSACHTSRKKAKGQVSAIEMGKNECDCMESDDLNEIVEAVMRRLQNYVEEV